LPAQGGRAGNDLIGDPEVGGVAFTVEEASPMGSEKKQNGLPPKKPPLRPERKKTALPLESGAHLSVPGRGGEGGLEGAKKRMYFSVERGQGRTGSTLASQTERKSHLPKKKA